MNFKSNHQSAALVTMTLCQIDFKDLKHETSAGWTLNLDIIGPEIYLVRQKVNKHRNSKKSCVNRHTKLLVNSNHISLQHEVDKIYRVILKFVAGKSVSFRALEDGFKAKKEDLIDAAGITINRDVVKFYITNSAVSITQIIQDERKGILFCLK